MKPGAEERREQEEGRLVVPVCVVDDHAAENDQGLTAHGVQQPRAVDALFNGRFPVCGEKGQKVRPDEEAPHGQGQPEEAAGKAVLPQEQGVLIAQKARARHNGQVAGAARMPAHVPEKVSGVETEAQNVHHPETAEHADVHVEEGQRPGLHAQEVQGDRDDARGHDHTEVGRSGVLNQRQARAGVRSGAGVCITRLPSGGGRG